ncbi:carbohydrate kinase family protein [Streptomyces parvus]|uniref:carbohydrate kinase family protein n=1 Tax=Streptomyces parvus TaxID=66428 RepID=UPI00123B4815|nr:carbohydrate kinase family protein [Streptomyces parvus]KAA6203874.1 carbohydrate kinase family protein [Streptomyces parvus]GGS31004.1 kinase [Streptomyces parvus]
MRITVTGSIATDHLMSFPGRFRDLLLPDRLDHVSLSFLTDRLEIRQGGVAANIATGLARLGLRPVLVGAAGQDFAEYAARLEGAGVDTGSVLISENLHTARFLCTTDADHNQVAARYAGAMTEARKISLAAVARRVGVPDLLVVAPNDPAAMLRHTGECRVLGIPFVADPSQQLARLDREETRRLVVGARHLFTNASEAALLLERTGWTRDEVLSRVGAWVTTHGADGAELARRDEPTEHVPAVPTPDAVDPTGVGDALRSGFLAAVARGLPLTTALRLGCAMATLVLESAGTQEYQIVPTDLLSRLLDAYGPSEAAALEPMLAELPRLQEYTG